MGVLQREDEATVAEMSLKVFYSPYQFNFIAGALGTNDIRRGNIFRRSYIDGYCFASD